MFKKRELSREIASLSAAAMMIPMVVLAESSSVIEEVMVTATRRAQSVQDVPYNISAISGDSIDQQGISTITELVKSIPGVSGPDLGARAGINNAIIMRGVNTSDAGQGTIIGNLSAAPVSTYLNETPLFTNLKLLDIDRVEVLRGPQGTLYGSGAMGGTLRFISQKPQMDERSFQLRAGISDADEGGGLSSEAQLIANLPVSDALAVRLALSHDQQAGVVDAKHLVSTDASGAPVLADPADIDSAFVTHSQKDVDDGSVSAAKISALWNVDSDTELLFSYMRQDEDWDHGTTAYIGDDSSIGGGADSWEDAVHQLEPVERSVDVASLELSKDFGFASFSSATSVTNDESEPKRDGSDFYVSLDVNFGFYYGFPRILVKDQIEEERSSLSQEFRLVSNGEGAFDWVAGVYFSKEELESKIRQQMLGFGEWADNPAALGGAAPAALGTPTIGDFIELAMGGVRPSANGDEVYTLKTTTEYIDKAAFGELSWHISEQWQATVGARVFRQTIKRDLQQTLPLCGMFCSDDFDPVSYTGNPRGLTQASHEKTFDDHILKFNTSYELNEDTMAYFTLSEGFRRGGANALPVAGAFFDPSYPLDYEPDKLFNKEIGLKGVLWSGRASYTVAAYHIDWSDVQVEAYTAGGFKGVANAEDAVSKGVELEALLAVSDNLQLSLGYSYNDAEITKDAIAGSSQVNAGDQLPFVSDHQANIAIDYDRSISGYELNLHVDGNYRSEFTTQVNNAQALNNYMELDGYSVFNTSATLSRDDWSLQFFVKNLTNEDGLGAVFVLGANGAAGSAEFGRRGWVSRPRTMGINVSYLFD